MISNRARMAGDSGSYDAPRARPVRLYAESFAPWCEKARWALDHHGVAYRAVEHVPLFGAMALRFAARRPLGRVTVPALRVGRRVVMDSLAIARYAEQVGSGARLFADDRLPAILAWNATSEAAMAAGRALLLARLQSDLEALGEQLPKAMPGPIRPALTGVVRLTVRHLMRKYRVDRACAGRDETALRAAALALRASIEGAGRYLVGDGFSYADVAMATALQFIAPVDDRYVQLGPATRRAWTHPALAVEFRDLLAWRDDMYQVHRRRRAEPQALDGVTDV